VLAAREHTRGAVLSGGQGGDGGRSGAPFGDRAGAAGGTHNTGCGARFRMLFGRRWRAPALGPVAAPLSQPGTSGTRTRAVAGITERTESFPPVPQHPGLNIDKPRHASVNKSGSRILRVRCVEEETIHTPS
jgi:hypothetical protein